MHGWRLRLCACEGPNRLAAASRSLRHCSTAHQFLSLFNAKPAQSSRICGVPCERWSARIDHSVTDAAAIVKQRCGAVTAPLDAQRVHHPNAHGQHVDMSRMSRQRAFALSCAHACAPNDAAAAGDAARFQRITDASAALSPVLSASRRSVPGHGIQRKPVPKQAVADRMRQRAPLQISTL